MNKLSTCCCCCLSLVLLAACGSAPTRLYTLQAVAPAQVPQPYDGPPVRVAAVSFPADFDRAEIVTVRSDGGMQINDLDHWAAPLGKLAQQTLSADLVARLPPGKVAFPRLPSASSGIELRVDILRAPGLGGMVASWQLALDSRTQRAGELSLPAEPVNGAASGVAHSLSEMLAHLADVIAAELPQASAGVAH